MEKIFCYTCSKSKADDLQIFYFKADYIYHTIYNVFIGYFFHGIFIVHAGN